MLGETKRVARSLEWWLTHRALALSRKAPARERNSPIDLAQIERVLVVRLDEIGDVVLSSPFLRELRCNLPVAHITLLVRPTLNNLVELCPYVNEVLTYEPPSSKYGRSAQAKTRAKRLADRHFVKKDFDLAIVPRWDTDSYYASMVSYLSGARNRVTYSELATQEKRRANAGLDHLFTHLVDPSPANHEVEKNLDLIRFLGGTVSDDRLELWCNEADELFADELLAAGGVGSDTPVVAIAPGARNARRRWPMAQFVELGRWLDGTLLVVGGEDDHTLGEEMRRVLGERVINAAGRTTLRQAAALLKRSQLFVGSDAGPMHLAAAAGRRVIEISCHPQGASDDHANSPVRFGPWRTPHIVLQPETARDSCVNGCDSSDAHCILGVSLERVKDAVSRLRS